jgi:hypothetical protein
MLSAYALHHFIEAMNGVIHIDPVDALHIAAQILEANQKRGYRFDFLAVREAVKLVSTILADHKYLFNQPSSLDDLIMILDAFYQLGWPEVFHLVGRLEEIFE